MALYTLSGFKFAFATSVLLCLLGWMSMVRTLHTTSAAVNCPNSQQQEHLQEWKEDSKSRFLSNNSWNGTQFNSKEAMQRNRNFVLFGNENGHPQAVQPLVPHAKTLPNQLHATTATAVAAPHTRRLRILFGIFTLDKPLQLPYRRQYRKLFEVFDQVNDTRVCSLYDFEHYETDERRYQCQFIYTFVVGGLKKKSAPTDLTDDAKKETPLLLPTRDYIIAKDIKHANDVTFLNIRENMNDGKSQTWFKYAASVLEKWDLDYAGKMDSDSLPYLDKFFHYAYNNLPPPPYNSGIIAGVPIDKLWWSKTKKEFKDDKAEAHFKKAYGKIMHLYAAGQCYLLSRDLCQTVVLEAPKSESYREGHEDHDISAMAFRSKNPISFHFLSLQQQFWRHPVKRYKKKVRKWRTLWHNEHVRMKRVLERQRDEAAAAAAKQAAEEETTPEELAAPVLSELEDNEGEEEEEEEEDATGEEDEDAEA